MGRVYRLFMRYKDFESRAWQVWEEIPDSYKEGIDGLMVHRRAVAHAELPDVFTLGECLTEEYPSGYGGPDTLRSYIALYHGSFSALAELDPDFDWEHELYQTVTHELQHHLESLASERALEDVDYAADENFKRLEGRDFDAAFYRAGTPLAEGVFQVEDDHFIEIPYRELGTELRFEWQGRTYRLDTPDDTGDVCFIEIAEGVPVERGVLTLVLVRDVRLRERMRRFFGGDRLRVVEWAAAAEPAR